MLAKTITLFLLAFILQAEALSTNNQDNSSVNKLISQELHAFNSEKLISLIGENSEILEELIPSVSSILYKMATCKRETTALVLPHIDDIMACINITLSLYDMEIFLYHAFQFGQEEYDNLLDLASDILECRNESSNGFDFIECALSTVESSSSMFQDFWSRTTELVSDSETDFYGLTDNVNKCMEFSSTTLFAAFHLLNSQC